MGVLRGVEADDLDGGRDDGRGYRSLLSGPEPEVRHFGGRDEEREFLAATLRSLVERGRPEEVCLVARTNALIRERIRPLAEEPRASRTRSSTGAGSGRTAASGWRPCTGSRAWSSR